MDHYDRRMKESLLEVESNDLWQLYKSGKISLSEYNDRQKELFRKMIPEFNEEKYIPYVERGSD